jgi:hypothetical protein
VTFPLPFIVGAPSIALPRLSALSLRGAVADCRFAARYVRLRASDLLRLALPGIGSFLQMMALLGLAVIIAMQVLCGNLSET